MMKEHDEQYWQVLPATATSAKISLKKMHRTAPSLNECLEKM